MKLEGSHTLDNIQKSFEGESRAIVRYYIYADIARKEGREEDEELFLKMARNEIEHAKIWYQYMEDMKGDTTTNLRISAGNENAEWKDMYPEFAQAAKEEGFLEIATLFERVSSIECDHERRFLEQSLTTLENASQTVHTNEVQHYCIFCGYASYETLSVCPVCGGEDAFDT
ncbi:MAG: rubrerythrin family protein [Eubacteriales bacterium]